MSLWQLLTPGKNTRLQARLAKEIAQRGRAELWKQVEGRACNMRLAEARGYMRARAAVVIHREVNQALACQGADNLSLDRSELVVLATDAVVTLLFRDLLHTPAKFGPLKHAA